MAIQDTERELLRKLAAHKFVTNGRIKEFSPTWGKVLTTAFVQIRLLECEAVYVRSNVPQEPTDFIDRLEVLLDY